MFDCDSLQSPQQTPVRVRQAGFWAKYCGLGILEVPRVGGEGNIGKLLSFPW